MPTMKILGECIEFNYAELHIHDLKFLEYNPRVYACTHGQVGFNKLTPEEQQEIIGKELAKQPSVKNLLPEIERHGGLFDHILVRWDTKQVVEGNSRLAAYRKLYENSDHSDDWEHIPCNVIKKFSDKQQAAFLSEIHVKGKTQWSAYEKANFAYVRYDTGKSTFEEVAEIFGESPSTIRKRVKSIKLMNVNNDHNLSHFSYYEVWANDQKINKELKELKKNDAKLGNLLEDKLLKEIKNFGRYENKNSFTAQDIRNKSPIVIAKPRVLKKYVRGEISLDEAYQRAKISGVEENIKKATVLIRDVSKDEVKILTPNDFNRFCQHMKKLERETFRVKSIVNDLKNRND